MKFKYLTFNLNLILAICLFVNIGYSQSDKYTEVEYTVVAEGTDSPIKNLQIVCLNKFFNKDYLPSDFREKYNLNDKSLYKKKMLVEIFRADTKNEALDKIELLGIKQDDENIVIEYNFINSDKTNDNKTLNPFLIVQIPKSKKGIKFIVDGVENGSESDIYLDN